MNSAPPETSDTAGPGTRDRWFMLALVASNYFTIYLHRNLVNYIQPALKEPIEQGGLGLTDFEIGLLGPAWLLPYCFAQLMVGYLSDRFPRRTVILASLMASVVALAATGLARNFPELFLGRVMLGIGQACAVPAMASVIADCFTDRTRSKAVGFYLFSYNCSLIIAGKYGGAIADIPVWRVSLAVFGGGELAVTGWRMAHFIFAAMGGAVWLLLWFLLREPERTERQAERGLGTESAGMWRSVVSVLAVRTFLLIAVVFALGGIVSRVVQFWWPRYFLDLFQESRGWNQEDAGEFATFWVQVGTMAGLFCGGFTADWASKRSIGGRMAVQLVGLLAMAPALVTIGSSHSIPLLASAMFVYGLGLGLYQANLWTTTFEVVDPAARATAVGLLNLSSGVLVLWWVDPAIGRLNDWATSQGGETILNTIIVSAGGIVGVSIVLMAFTMIVLLPRDFRRRDQKA
ncbi:MAG: MFS transporter [Planctomycetes bacterium]|nr:MFS transporter [Planctomycetota bacterium]